MLIFKRLNYTLTTVPACSFSHFLSVCLSPIHRKYRLLESEEDKPLLLKQALTAEARTLASQLFNDIRLLSTDKANWIQRSWQWRLKASKELPVWQTVRLLLCSDHLNTINKRCAEWSAEWINEHSFSWIKAKVNLTTVCSVASMHMAVSEVIMDGNTNKGGEANLWNRFLMASQLFLMMQFIPNAEWRCVIMMRLYVPWASPPTPPPQALPLSWFVIKVEC